MENMQANLKIINVLKSKGITAVYDLRQRRGKKKKTIAAISEELMSAALNGVNYGFS